MGTPLQGWEHPVGPPSVGAAHGYDGWRPSGGSEPASTVSGGPSISGEKGELERSGHQIAIVRFDFDLTANWRGWISI